MEKRETELISLPPSIWHMSCLISTRLNDESQYCLIYYLSEDTDYFNVDEVAIITDTHVRLEPENATSRISPVSEHPAIYHLEFHNLFCISCVVNHNIKHFIAINLVIDKLSMLDG